MVGTRSNRSAHHGRRHGNSVAGGLPTLGSAGSPVGPSATPLGSIHELNSDEEREETQRENPPTIDNSPVRGEHGANVPADANTSDVDDAADDEASLVDNPPPHFKNFTTKELENMVREQEKEAHDHDVERRNELIARLMAGNDRAQRPTQTSSGTAFRTEPQNNRERRTRPTTPIERIAPRPKRIKSFAIFKMDADSGDDVQDKDTVNAERSVRVVKPQRYSGKSVTEHRKFVQQCEAVFKLQPETYRYSSARIRYAASYFDGAAHLEWLPLEKYLEETGGYMRWVEFKEEMLTWQDTPDIRKLQALQKWSAAKHREGEPIRRFVQYLTTLEAQISPFTEAQKMEMLMAKMAPSLATEVVTYHRRPTDRRDLVDIATNLESRERNLESAKSSGERARVRAERGALARPGENKGKKPEYKGKGSYKGPSVKTEYSSTSHPNTYNKTNTRFSHQTEEVKKAADEKKADDKATNSCYYCHKPGHLYTECQRKRRDVERSAKVSAAMVQADEASCADVATRSNGDKKGKGKGRQ